MARPRKRDSGSPLCVRLRPLAALQACLFNPQQRGSPEVTGERPGLASCSGRSASSTITRCRARSGKPSHAPVQRVVWTSRRIDHMPVDCADLRGLLFQGNVPRRIRSVVFPLLDPRRPGCKTDSPGSRSAAPPGAADTSTTCVTSPSSPSMTSTTRCGPRVPVSQGWPPEVG